MRALDPFDAFSNVNKTMKNGHKYQHECERFLRISSENCTSNIESFGSASSSRSHEKSSNNNNNTTAKAHSNNIKLKHHTERPNDRKSGGGGGSGVDALDSLLLEFALHRFFVCLFIVVVVVIADGVLA